VRAAFPVHVPIAVGDHGHMTKPLLLLDVDGVLRPFGHDEGHVEAVLDFDPIRYDPQTPARLARLAAQFRLVWATAWEDAANDLLAPLFELPPLPVIRFDDQVAISDSWKLPAIKRFVGEHPFAWIDDDVGPDAHRWAGTRGVATLLLDIEPQRGLHAGHEQELLAYAASVNPGARRSP